MPIIPPIFTATNSTDLEALFFERALYEFFFLSGEIDSDKVDFQFIPGIRNYWQRENILYGKVDKHLVVIEPIQQYMGSILQDGTTFNALSAVTNSYEKFKNFFTLAARRGTLSSDAYLQEPQIYKAYEDASIKYSEYVTKLIRDFNEDQIFRKEIDNQIKNIKDYANLFFKYVLENDDVKYLTRTSYYLSNNVSSLNSGLSIEIADLDPSDNSDKQLILDSDNFNFYRQAAINAGFVIDKNIPWRLNFDLSSPANAEKIKNTTGSTDPVQYYLSSNFLQVRTGDVEYLISLVILGYNSIVDKKDFYTKGRCRFDRNRVEKSVVLEEVLKGKYWVKKYIQVKNKESGFQYTDSEIRKIIFNANDIPRGQIEYVDKKFRFPFLQEGSTTYTILKNYFLQNKNLSVDKFSQYVIMLLKRSINEIY
jgi:hypothetical protein